jgi:hypothetical protein
MVCIASISFAIAAVLGDEEALEEDEDDGTEDGRETVEETGFEDGISDISAADETGGSEDGWSETNSEVILLIDTPEEEVFAKVDFVT